MQSNYSLEPAASDEGPLCAGDAGLSGRWSCVCVCVLLKPGKAELHLHCCQASVTVHSASPESETSERSVLVCRVESVRDREEGGIKTGKNRDMGGG